MDTGAPLSRKARHKTELQAGWRRLYFVIRKTGKPREVNGALETRNRRNREQNRQKQQLSKDLLSVRYYRDRFLDLSLFATE